MQGSLVDVGLPASLFLIMIGMGLTLTPKDFREVLVAPKATLFGLLAQVLVVPLAAFALAWSLSLDPLLAVGLVIIAACPGGTTSNRSEEHTSELQSRPHLVCRLLLEKKKKI